MRSSTRILRLPTERKGAASPPEAKHLSRFQVKGTTDQRQFTGLASTWDLDEGGDMILPGAYKATLAEWQQSGRTMPLINQHNYHDARHAIGKMIAAEETTEGLVATFQVVNSPEGDEFLARIKDGIIDGLSIGYSARKWRPPTDAEKTLGVQRVLEEIDLREVSLVIWGMNPNALIDTASVKSLAQTLTQLRRDTLSDDDRKTLRQIASTCGALLRPADASPSPEAGAAGAADTGKSGAGAPGTPNPDAPPGGDPAAARTGSQPPQYAHMDALKQRLVRLRVQHALSAAGHATTTTGRTHV
jgi:HK97 family phage prohead protease